MKVRHILGISGGKDSAALAIYLKQKYPSLKIEYYNSDTGCVLAVTETLINRLEAYLGKIERLRAAEGSTEPTPFHHFLKVMGGFLPSPQARWCTKKMKLDKFEEYVGDEIEIPFEVDGKTGTYCRSRSGCYFCFFQQKIEWIWLYEQHPDLYKQAIEFEKDGYTWNQNESLADLIKPERIRQIKLDIIRRQQANKEMNKGTTLVDILGDDIMCTNCFI